MSKIYAGIGSREAPERVLETMTSIAEVLAEQGWILRSGGAPGCDSAFEIGADNVNGKKEIFLPWRGFNNNTSPYFINSQDSKCFEIASKFHPVWDRLTDGVKKLHARNVKQVLGNVPGISPRTDLVICWTSDGKASGGTGQALRIAEYFGVPVLNLHGKTKTAVIKFINSL